MGGNRRNVIVRAGSLIGAAAAIVAGVGKHQGKCNFSNNAVPLARGAVATFLAAGVITV